MAKQPKTEESNAYDRDTARRLIALDRAIKATAPKPPPKPQPKKEGN